MQGANEHRKSSEELNKLIRTKSAELSALTTNHDQKKKEHEQLRITCLHLEDQVDLAHEELSKIGTQTAAKNKELGELNQGIIKKTDAFNLAVKKAIDANAELNELSRKIDATTKLLQDTIKLAASTKAEYEARNADLVRREDAMAKAAQLQKDGREKMLSYAKRINGYYEEIRMKPPIPMDF